MGIAFSLGIGDGRLDYIMRRIDWGFWAVGKKMFPSLFLRNHLFLYASYSTISYIHIIVYFTLLIGLFISAPRVHIFPDILLPASIAILLPFATPLL